MIRKLTGLVCLFALFFSLLVQYPALAQTTERPFSKEGGCTSPKTTSDGFGFLTKDCDGSFTWPEGDETPPGDYSINKGSVVVTTIDERGIGTGCSNPSFEEEPRTVDIPGIGPAVVPIARTVKVSYDARGKKELGVRGRIECKVSGAYNSQ